MSRMSVSAGRNQVTKEEIGSQDSHSSYLHQGLEEYEIGKRQRTFGLNTIQQTREIQVLSIVLEQFKSPLIYILVIAAGVTMLLQDYVDTAIIGLAVVVNTILGFYQEYKAQKALAALRSLLSPKATVMRNGSRQVVDASDIVPGDVCYVGLGEHIPADSMVVFSEDFSVNEAILTGESVPVRKKAFREREVVFSDLDQLTEKWDTIDRSVKVFAGTTVSSGEATVIITITGLRTEVGKIAKSLQETVEGPTPLQKRISKLSNQLAIIVGIAATVIFITGLVFNTGDAAIRDRFEEMFTTSVAVAVSAIPEGLAVSLTAILALGMQRILRRKALVRKLVAAETLGSVTTICADKTGTLTEGVMRVTEADFVDESEGVKAAVLTNDRRDSLEIAMWNWVVDVQKHDAQREVDANNRIDSIPFSPQHKYSAKLYEDGAYMIGAPELVLSFCSTSGSSKQRWIKKFDEYGLKGMRLVGFARRKRKRGERRLSRKSVQAGMEWLGILIYEDPIRVGVATALEEAKKAGISVKVITGDYRATAEGVLEQLGILTQKMKLSSHQPLVMDGSELDQLSIDELRSRVTDTVLFVRTDPTQKLKIVEALQANGEVVAMTGDGVNDAPSLKRADIGIVVSSSSDVAKETADMVLLDNNFATIISAVEEGRGIYENLRKVILYLLSDAFAEVVLVMSSLLFRLPLPVTAAQILWINLVDDGLPNLALTVDPKEADLLKRTPRKLDEPLLDKEIKVLMVLISTSAAFVVLIVFAVYFQLSSIDHARTMAFTGLAVSTLIYVFSTRSLRNPVWKEGFFVNKWLVVAVLGGFGLQLSAIYIPFLQEFLETVPLSLVDWIVIFGSALVVVAVVEITKFLFIKSKLLNH